MTKDAQAFGTDVLRNRQHWMSVLAKAGPKAVAEKMATFKSRESGLPAYSVIRPAESGAVMLRGRAGGTGAPFNLGELSVTRCVVQLAGAAEGAVIGHAYVAGRDRRHAEDAAFLDALLQTERWGRAVLDGIVRPLAAAAETAREERRAKVAATKVNFFTMVRGEN